MFSFAFSKPANAQGPIASALNTIFEHLSGSPGSRRCRGSRGNGREIHTRSPRPPREITGIQVANLSPNLSLLSTILLHLILHPGPSYPPYPPSLSALSTIFIHFIHLVHHSSPPSPPSFSSYPRCPLFCPPSHATARLRVGSMNRKALKYQQYRFLKSKSVLPKMYATSALLGNKFCWPHLGLFQARSSMGRKINHKQIGFVWAQRACCFHASKQSYKPTYPNNILTSF